MWEISLNGQITAVLSSIVLGALLAVLYDFIRATRDAGLNSFAAVFIGDLLFWIISAVTVFIFLVGVTNGEIRGYVILCTALGFIVYRFTLSKAVHFLFFWILHALVLALRRLSLILYKTVEFCEKPVKGLLSGFISIIKYLFAVVKKLLKSMHFLLYTVKDKKKQEYDVNEQGRKKF